MKKRFNIFHVLCTNDYAPTRIDKKRKSPLASLNTIKMMGVARPESCVPYVMAQNCGRWLSLASDIS